MIKKRLMYHNHTRFLHLLRNKLNIVCFTCDKYIYGFAYAYMNKLGNWSRLLKDVVDNVQNRPNAKLNLLNFYIRAYVLHSTRFISSFSLVEFKYSWVVVTTCMHVVIQYSRKQYETYLTKRDWSGPDRSLDKHHDYSAHHITHGLVKFHEFFLHEIN